MSEHQFQAMREAMVSNQLRTTAVSDPKVVGAMKSVAREKYVPEDRKALAYVDVATPLGNGRSLNPPMVTGRLLTEAGVEATDTVLLVGAATGYAAELLARLAGRVVAVETNEALYATAQVNLKSFANVALVNGGLETGAPRKGPFDVVVIDGAVESVPDALVKQLKEGGRIVAVLIDEGIGRISRGVKAGDALGWLPVVEADAAHLPGFATPKGFSF